MKNQGIAIPTPPPKPGAEAPGTEVEHSYEGLHQVRK